MEQGWQKKVAWGVRGGGGKIGSSSPVTSHLAPSITVLVFPDSADAYSRTTASYRLTQHFKPNTGTGGAVCKGATPSVEQPGGRGFKPRLRSLLD
jgi:hypothetical protein